MPTVPPLYEASVRFPVAERVRFSRVTRAYILIHVMVTLLYQTLQSTLGYDTVIWLTWVTAAGRNFSFKIAAKALQTWLLLTAYRKVIILSNGTIADLL